MKVESTKTSELADWNHLKLIENRKEASQVKHLIMYTVSLQFCEGL